MYQCQFDVLNKSTVSNGIVEVYYVPHAISTLKISIKNAEEHTKVSIKPKSSSNNDDYCGGFVDNRSEGVEISWGGGNREGTVISLAHNETKYAFIYVNHDSTTEPANYILTLEAYLEVGFGRIDTYKDYIGIKLIPVSSDQDTVHEISDDSITTYEGTLLGNYSPRWFPLVLDPRNYYSVAKIPNLQIILERKKMGFENDRIILKINNIEVGVIIGDMDGASFYTNLFKFSEKVFVLRIWLFWLSKHQFDIKENLKTISIPIERGIDFPPELPDSERYDIMLSGNGKILAVGTDYHWQEYWCELKSTSLNGVIAFPFHDYFGLLNLLIKKLSDLLRKVAMTIAH